MAEQTVFDGSFVERRPMSDAERAELERKVGPAHEGAVEMLKMAAFNLGFLGAIVYFGWDVQWVRRCGILFLVVAVCYFLWIIIADLIHGYRLTNRLRADLAAGVVEVRSLRLLAAKRFQEPEHQGFLYFLRTDDDRVYVTFDWESQALHENEEDPLSSTFKPATHVQVVRGPVTRQLLKEQFSGAPLDLPAPIPLTADPEDWPEIGEFCLVAWQELESKFSMPKGRARRNKTGPVPRP